MCLASHVGAPENGGGLEDGRCNGRATTCLIIGGGNAGFGVTVPTRKAGMKVAMVEERDLGGTCPNRGCTPKKVLVAAGHALHEIGQAHVHYISVGKPTLDWAALIDREKEMIAASRSSLAETLEEPWRRSHP